MKFIRKTLLFIVFIAILGFGANYLYQGVMNREIHINNLFVGSFVKGVDISSYQEDVDFTALRSEGIEFAFIKATEGAEHTDTSFASKWSEAEAAGLTTGAYLFFSF